MALSGPSAPAFIRYWSDSGRWSELALNGSVVNDPKRTSMASRPTLSSVLV